MGYSIDLFQSKEAAESYICTVCLDVVENPMFLGKCEHCLCNECLNGITNKRCPMKCKVHFQPKVPGPAFLRPYNALKLACELCSVWKGSLGDLTTHHKNECPMFPIQCSNQGCQQVRVRNKMNTIHSQLCSQRILPCLYCGDKFTFEKMRYHFVECEEYPLPCENKECTAVLPKKQLPSHKSLECLFSVVPCEWSEFGCNHKATRSDMDNHHRDSTAQHLHCVKNVLDRILAILPQDQVKRALNGLKSENNYQQQGSSSLIAASESYIERNKNVTDGQIQMIIGSKNQNRPEGTTPPPKKLRRLDLSSCGKLTDISILDITQNCKQLEELDLSNCVRLTDASITEITETSEQLESLNLRGCIQITDKSAISLSQHCKLLRTLDLGGCVQITNSSITSLSQHCTQLNKLYLKDCAKITDQAATKIAQKCTQLKELSLSNCTLITDTTITQLSHNCKQLQVLFLSGCKQISDAAVSSLVKNCLELNTCVLEGCQNVSNELREKLQSLRIKISN
eukprot:TRINITY_DN5131_c0_g4_i1.p1 TRINITY_DN5131_c0_g4~~TRINITY_DN5131_c0_g4_i1.p1  ORF type:complete len:512 (-),score=54.18 TRINITY_DN5131_c0_g4_i1:150-1685(-)